MENNGNHSQLRATIETHYNLNELRGLAHDLQIDFEQLEPGPLTTKVVSFISYAARQGKLEQLETLVEKHVASKALPDRAEDREETPPYQGLNYFDVGDTDRYFGRDALITSLIQRINDEKLNFLIIVGASGSGKSSLVGVEGYITC